MLDRLRDALARLRSHPASPDELDAALALLVLAAFADRKLKEGELDELHAWVDAHEEIAQRVPVVIAHVRAALDDDPDGDSLIAAADAAITHRDLRDEVAEVCRAVIDADAERSIEEARILDRIALSFPLAAD